MFRLRETNAPDALSDERLECHSLGFFLEDPGTIHAGTLARESVEERMLSDSTAHSTPADVAVPVGAAEVDTDCTVDRILDACDLPDVPTVQTGTETTDEFKPNALPVI